MKTPVQFYFDFSSPYGYFAAMRINELAARYGREVDWHPVLLGIIFKTTETKPLVAIPLKGEYSLHDLNRTARFHQIPFNVPSEFPIATQHAARAVLWIQKQHGKQAAVQFAQRCFQAYFVDGVVIGAPEAVTGIAAQCGLDAQQVGAGMQQQDIKDQLKAEVDQALQRGVFGSPYFIIDDESYFYLSNIDLSKNAGFYYSGPTQHQMLSD